MGNKLCVYGWKVNDNGLYEFVQFYAGEDYAEAIETMLDLKRRGIGCIRLDWRP